MNTQQNANKDDGKTPSEVLVEQTRVCMLQRKADRLQREVNALRAERRTDMQDEKEWVEHKDHSHMNTAFVASLTTIAVLFAGKLLGVM